MMKKITFLLVCLFSFTFLMAQVERDKVVVEVGTGTWCTYCPGAAMGVDDLIENGWPVAAVENHNGDPFANVYSNARNSFYGIDGFPTAFFDGVLSVVGGNHTESMYPSYLPRVQQRMNVPSPVTISVYGSHTDLTYDIVVTVTKVADLTGSNTKLQVCITESHIVYAWEGMSEVNYVNRLMVPNQNGTTLNFDSTDVLEIPLTFTLQSGWSLPNIELVAFVQCNSNKEIQNGYKVKLAWMAPPPAPLVASFTSDTVTCEGNEVQFTDMSSGNPTGWYWEFPGGTPDTSRDENPVIAYNTAGKYDVSLVVTRGNTTDTSYMPEYISVYALPEVTFDPLDVQCVNWPAFELTEGMPAGGVYEGPGVSDGYFDPAQAGIGSHTLTYTYMDEYGCSNVADQTVVVDACTGIPENQGVKVVTIPNPSQGSFKLAVSGLEDVVNVKIFNSIGKSIFEKDNIQVGDNFNMPIDLSGNSSGIYYLQVKGKTSTYYQKIILQN